MKNLLNLTIAALCACSLFACKKDGTSLSNEEILQKKISDIIPQKYIDTLVKLGLPINEGTTPTNMEGAYVSAKNLLLASNIVGDVKNQAFTDGYFKLFGQKSDFSIQLLGKNFLNKADTSIVTAISGIGNNITVYGKVKSTTGNSSAIFAILLSGMKEGNTIKDLKYGLINIDGSKDISGFFIKEGQARIAYDADGIGAAVANYDAIGYRINNDRINLLQMLQSSSSR